MKTIAIRVAVALLLAAGAWVCWREARLVDRAADSLLALALLRYFGEEPVHTTRPKSASRDISLL